MGEVGDESEGAKREGSETNSEVRQPWVGPWHVTHRFQFWIQVVGLVSLAWSKRDEKEVGERGEFAGPQRERLGEIT